MCPRAGLGSFLGRPLGRKQAGQMVFWHQGRGGEGESASVYMELCAENQGCKTDLPRVWGTSQILFLGTQNYESSEAVAAHALSRV